MSIMPTLHILHLDDDPFELSKVEKALSRNSIHCKFTVDSASNVSIFKNKLISTPRPDLVILDIHIDDQHAPEESGITIAREVRRTCPDAVVLMRSSDDEVSTIAECLNSGADDFISKQSDRGELSLRVYNSYRLATLKRGIDSNVNSAMQPQVKEIGFAGNTMRRVAMRIPSIIESAISSIYVSGESGTGKEIVADLFTGHIKPGTPFLKVNCGAIVQTLLESELFGHAKGAFTGAATEKKGFIERASGGWIFLDEIATLPLPSQVALLRVIENQEVTKVGSTTSIPVKVRIVSASNENLEHLVKIGRFRQDLWQRICETELFLPPLRERSDEIPELIDFFCKSMPGGPYQATDSVVEVLSSIPWKSGNVRELRNCLRAMTEFSVDKLLTPLAIPERVWEDLKDECSDGEISMLKENKGHENKTNEQNSPDNFQEINLNIDFNKPILFSSLIDQLLLIIIKHLAEKQGKYSLRRLSKTIGISRSTLSGKLKELVAQNLVTLQDLSKFVSVSEKEE